MREQNTRNAIKTEIEALSRNITGRPSLSAVECDIVYGSIVDAFQLVLLEYGVETFRFHEKATEITASAGSNYIDLPAHSYRVMTGTVTIPSSGSFLSLMNEAEVQSVDPELDKTGEPSMYWYMASDDPDVMRLGIWPIPTSDVVIRMRTLQYPEDSLDEFPAALASAIKHKAKSMACLGLGMQGLKQGFDMAYEEVIAKIKDGYDNDGPRHVPKLFGSTINGRSVEGRITQ